METVSPYIIAPVSAWIISQVVKYIAKSIQLGRLTSPRLLYLSGSMPSAHSATVVALLTVIGVSEGIGSPLFGLALLFSVVVMYDAMMVRRSSGEQGQSLTALIKEQKSKVRLPRVAMGHTPLEVAAGALLGLVIGIVVSFATII